MSGISGVLRVDAPSRMPEGSNWQLVAGGIRVSFDGRLDNRRELMTRCQLGPGAGEREVPEAVLVAAAYRMFGDSCAEHLAGDFAFALVDDAAHKLVLARDLMGIRSLYYCARPGGVFFASTIAALVADAGIEAVPDEDGLADLVVNGYFDGHRTWFRGVWSVPPGGVVTAAADRVHVGASRELPVAEIRYSSFPEYVEHFRALFTQAVTRRLAGVERAAIAVSGGLDSSSIHSVAARQSKTAVHGFTLAFPRGSAADEHDFVEVLRAQGLRIDAIPVDGLRWVSAESPAIQPEMPRLAWDQQQVLFANAREAGCRVLLDGYLGDQLLAGGAFLIDLVRAGRWREAARQLDQRVSWMADVDPGFVRRQFVAAVLGAALPEWSLPVVRHSWARLRAWRRDPPWFTKSFRERAVQRSLDRSRRRPRRRASSHAEYCRQLAASGHYQAAVLQSATTAAARGIDVAFPFADRDLFTFIAAIPGEIVNHRGVPKALLREAMDGLVPDTIRLRRTKADFTPFSNRAARAELATMRQRLGADSLCAQAGFIDPDVLRRVEAKMDARLGCDDSAELGWQLTDTLGLELWLTRWCGGGHAVRA